MNNFATRIMSQLTIEEPSFTILNQLPEELLIKCLGTMDQPRIMKVCEHWRDLIAANRMRMKAFHVLKLTLFWSNVDGMIYIDVAMTPPEKKITEAEFFKYLHRFACEEGKLFDMIWFLYPQTLDFISFSETAADRLLNILPNWWLEAIKNVSFIVCDIDYRLVLDRMPSLTGISIGKSTKRKYPKYKILKCSEAPIEDHIHTLQLCSIISSMRSLHKLNIEFPCEISEGIISEIVNKSNADPEGLIELNLYYSVLTFDMAMKLIKGCKFHPNRYICLYLSRTDIEKFHTCNPDFDWNGISPLGALFTSGIRKELIDMYHIK